MAERSSQSMSNAEGTVSSGSAMTAYPNRCLVTVGRLNGWECQRISGVDRVLYLIERADGKLHEAPQRLRAKIDAAVDGASTESRK